VQHCCGARRMLVEVCQGLCMSAGHEHVGMPRGR
jgi:hypothetical protein